jgi:Protein of Unknown function (DUF2604)
LAQDEDEHRRERGHAFILIFIINGQDYPTRVDPRLALSIAVHQVLKESGNTGRPAEEWEVRDASGVLLETNRSPHDLGLHDRARLFLSLKVGAGGVGQSRH